MCYRPIHIQNPTTYYVRDISYTAYDVPCGHCLECEQLKQSEWQTRIAFELSSLYGRGGRAVFLTFTYSPSFLPVYEDKDYIVPDTGEHLCISCFNHDDVLTFLNRIKVYMNKKYGKGSYKYFVCSEYGKDTKRPHYHVIFFLEPYVAWFDFVEKCRAKWTYGFMFPKYDRFRGVYIDKNGHPMSDGKPCISSLGGCAKYVSKYITKDMSYYGLPVIDEYLYYIDKYGKKKIFKSHLERMRHYLPKHWQSNGLGLSALDYFSVNNENSVKEVIENGILNPLTFKYVPLPSYIVNKLMFYNVNNGRVSPISGKPLYDRYLTDFGRIYMHHVFRTRVAQLSQKMSECFQSSQSPFVASPHPDFKDWSSVGVSDISSPSSFVPAALYRMVYKYAPVRCIEFILKGCDGDISSLYNIDYAFNIWIDNKDTEYLATQFYIEYPRCSFEPCDMSVCSSFLPLKYLVDCYEKVSFEKARLRCEENKRRSEELARLRSMLTHKFDNRLC